MRDVGDEFPLRLVVGLQLGGQIVQGPGQIAQLVFGGEPDPVLQISGGELARALRDPPHRLQHPAPDQGQDQEREQEDQDVDRYACRM